LLNSLSDLKDVGLREFFTGTFQAVQPLLVQFTATLGDPKITETRVVRVHSSELRFVPQSSRGPNSSNSRSVAAAS
jgi:hypothetical protein